MAESTVRVNDPKAVKRFSGRLAVEVAKKAFWQAKMMSVGPDAVTPVQKQTDLEKKKSGDTIGYDLSLQMRMKPVRGQQKLAGKEDRLRWSSAEIKIDLVRGGIHAGDRMSEQRTLHNLRETAKGRQGEWWTRVYDEDFFMHCAGGRGVNAGFVEDLTYDGGVNPFKAPDAEHIVYGGSATAKTNLGADDTINLNLIDRLVTKAKNMGGDSSGIPALQPVMVDGREHFVLVMSPNDEHNLRTEVGTNTHNWLEIQKHAGVRGKENPIFKDSLGMYRDVIMHCHKSVVTFDDYGSGSDVAASRLLFLGRQALQVAFGNAGKGLSFKWHEELEDRGNEVVVTTHSMYGVKKNTFEIDGVDRDFGMISADVASKDPD